MEDYPEIDGRNVHFEFFMVRDRRKNPISSEQYDLWEVDQAAKREGLIRSENSKVKT